MKLKNKKTNTSKLKLSNITTNKPLVITIIIALIIVGLYLVYRSFAASGIPVFHTDPDYWRDRIGYCESGGRYDRVGPGGHTGKYQFGTSTWRGAVGPQLAAQYPQAYLAPPEIQDMAYYNTFARRGTQPWNASYHCWIKGSIVAEAPAQGQTIIEPRLVGLPTAPPLPAQPFGIPSESYNVLVSGRATLNNQPLANLKLFTCVADKVVTTDIDGRFSVPIPLDSTFCLRPIDGIPDGAVLTRTNNNIEHIKDKTYEQQKAGINCYHNIWCIFGDYYSWDRKNDTGYNFYYAKP